MVSAHEECAGRDPLPHRSEMAARRAAELVEPGWIHRVVRPLPAALAPAGALSDVAARALRLARAATHGCPAIDAPGHRCAVHVSHEKDVAEMKSRALKRTVALGALSGMRSMAGPAALMLDHEDHDIDRGPRRVLERVVPLLAVGEMIADKLPFMGDRIDPLPLAGRAAMGALVGGVIAREEHGSVMLGGLIGAVAAVAVAHVAYQLRKRLPGSNVFGGVLEDGIVIGLGALYASTSERAAG